MTRRRRRLLSATCPCSAVCRREQVRAVERILDLVAERVSRNGKQFRSLDGVVWFSNV